jgi:ABC-2 type transport system ATP-binding protein
LTPIAALSLARRFGDRLAVDGVSFEVAAGEVFGLLGPNGAGKTTTLRMLAGLISPTSGEVRLGGEPFTRQNGSRMRRRIGFLTETPGLWDQLTVLDNMVTYARLFDVGAPARVCEASLRSFGLWERRGDRAVLLSKGMKQKLALARALVHDPEVILLDEPTANLDPEASRAVRDLLAELRGRGRAVVISTHNLDEVERLADRVALVSTRLIAVGHPADLRERLFGRRLRIRLAGTPERMSVFVDAVARAAGAEPRTDRGELLVSLADSSRGAPHIIRALVEAGADILEAYEDHPPLEDVYLQLLDASPPKGPDK